MGILTEERIENAIQSGSDQFWQQIVAEFPEVDDGQFLIDDTWNEYLRIGLIHWLQNNHPTCQGCIHRHRNVKWCTPCNFTNKSD